ncbi:MULTISPECIES: FliH/SctL family protein [unclassified Pseudomonas]|uniref:FliH/SctL family protein n=1 Tax=unclassified Pseudomonas TaxID=196821 RepID=UPI000BC563C3|nr:MULTISPECIES: FliH/SctL family protein [unclassified Pseudomonas]PVZ12535.1 type III secretion protein L [Pseudomonas sp. URIL14HWK12:I12]PVZ23313.1 type III secretion protein L [Pseudomonas sp. URIL14HWK12:I10]PVZ32643.1 type III secretion protein L [Pseudomonas sp. URIL14HWK12:I11]SNZ13797.1 type III secretion protein L [Pseudomonas sp. URIL14HWK12:I9]
MSELPTRPAARILRAEQADQWIDGFAFLEAARQEADQMRQSAELWRQQARREGLEQGLAQGRAQMAQALLEQRQAHDQWLASQESALADLALAIAGQLIGELPDTQRLQALVRTALASFRQDQALTLYVPRDAVDSSRQALMGLAVTVEADEQLAPGQARLASAQGAVELGVQEQLAQLRRALLPFANDEATP